MAGLCHAGRLYKAAMRSQHPNCRLYALLLAYNSYIRLTYIVSLITYTLQLAEKWHSHRIIFPRRDLARLPSVLLPFKVAHDLRSAMSEFNDPFSKVVLPHTAALLAIDESLTVRRAPSSERRVPCDKVSLLQSL